MLLHHSIQEHSLVATGIPWHNRIVRDWYTGCAQPSQGCETGSTPVSRSSNCLYGKHLQQAYMQAVFAGRFAGRFGVANGN